MITKTRHLTRTERLRKALLQAFILSVLTVFLGLGTNHFRSDGIALVADWSPGARLQAVTGDNRMIRPDDAVIFHDTGEAVFIDARSASAFETAHIPGALNIPWMEVDQYIDLLLNQVSDPETVIITYCEGGACSLSEDLALMLLELGYMNVKVLANGLDGWIAAGQPAKRTVKQNAGAQ